MQPLAEVQCPACHQASRVEYRRLGSATLCLGCHRHTVPRVPVGGSYPITQWELKFQDFLRLLRDRASRQHVEPLLVSWFGYRLRGEGNETQIQDFTNQALDPLTVHLAIQDDPPKQLAFYRAAMSLWR